jgi:hypothetical protein
MTRDDQVVIAMGLLQARHTPPPNDPAKYPYRLIPFDELRPGTKSAYLVEGVIPRAGLVAIWGPPKCGKSFWTFDLVMHVALRWKYRGRRVNGGPVAYLAFEGAEGFKSRAEAFRRTHEIPGKLPFFLIATNAKLVRDHQALIDSINGQMNAPPVVVVLDTLNRSIEGSESKDEDMGGYLAAAETIHQEFDCAVLIVHHCGIDGSRPRGHTSLTGAVDSQIAVRRDAAQNVTAEVEAMKDGPEGAHFTSALKIVEVGIDDDGEAMTSCVIVPELDAPQSAGKSARVTANQNRFLDILHEAVLDAPDSHKTRFNIPGGRTAISRDWLKMCCISKGWLDDDDSNRSRAKLSEMINTLAGKRIIGASKLHVWLAT